MKKLWDKLCKTLPEVSGYLVIIIILELGIIGGLVTNLPEPIEPNPQAIFINIPLDPSSYTIGETKPVIKQEVKPIVKRLSEREVIDSYVNEICLEYDMDPELIRSIIVSESDYNPNETTGNHLGLMQVSPRWHSDRAERLNVTDFYDPYGNILLGVDYLSELFNKYKDPRLVLMLYNMNHKTAFNMYKQGQTSSYAKTVLARAEEYRKGE